MPDDADAAAAAFEALRAGRRRGVAAVRRARPADLGRQRADVPRRADDRPARAAAPDALAARPRRRSTRCARCTACAAAHVRRPAPRAVGRALRDVLGLVAVPGAGDAGLHPAHRVRATAAGTRAAGSTRCGPRCERVAESRRRRGAHRASRSSRIATTGDAVTGVELADGATRRRAGRRRQRRRRARLRRPAARRAGAAPGPAGRRARRAGSSSLAARARRDARHRPPQRVVLRRRPRPSSPPSPPGAWPTTRRSTPASRPVTDPTQAPAGTRELVPARQRAAGHPPRRRRRAAAACSTCSPAAASTCATRVDVERRRSRRCSSPAGTARPAARSTARRRTAGGPRSCGPRNRGARRGLYLVGGSSHPGGGLPLVADERARSSPTMIAADVTAVRPRRRAGRPRVGRRRGGRAQRSARAAPARRRRSRRRPPTHGPISRRRAGPRRGGADRAAAGRRRRRAGRRRGRRRRRRVGRRHRGGRRGGGRTRSSPARRRRPGWAGKAWALQQGLDARDGRRGSSSSTPTPARRPDLPARARRPVRRRRPRPAHASAGRFDCPTAGAALAAPGAADDARLPHARRRAPRDRARCTGAIGQRAVHGVRRRARCVAAGGFGAVAHHTVEDVALVRTMATAGFAVGYLDAADLLTVRMYETRGRGVARLGPLARRCPASTRRPRRLVGLATVALAQAAPARAPRRPPCRRPRRRAARRPRRHARRHGPRVHAAAAPPYWLSPTRRRRRRRRARPLDRRRAARRGAAADAQPACAIQNRRPTSDMRAPVAAVRRGPVDDELDHREGGEADPDAARRRPRRRARRRAPAAIATRGRGRRRARRPPRRTWRRCDRRGSGRTAARRGRPSPPPRRRTPSHHSPRPGDGAPDRRRRRRPWRCRRRAPAARRAARAPPWRSTTPGCGRRPRAGRRAGGGRRSRPSGSSRAGSRRRPARRPGARHARCQHVPWPASRRSTSCATHRALDRDAPPGAPTAGCVGRPGLAFWRLLGTGRGADTGPSADLRRTALFAVWDDEAATSTASCAAVAGAGQASSSATTSGCGRSAATARGAASTCSTVSSRGAGDGPIAVVTRADVRVRAWRRFRAAGPTGQRRAAAAPAACSPSPGVGELPVGRLGTFSLWRGVDAMRPFAASPRHRDVVRRTRAERWYGEELFARFEPYGASGTWDGRDPLALTPCRRAAARHDRHEHPVRRPAEAVVQLVGGGEPLERRARGGRRTSAAGGGCTRRGRARTPRRRP